MSMKKSQDKNSFLKEMKKKQQMFMSQLFRNPELQKQRQTRLLTLLQQGVSINHKDDFGDTALCKACEEVDLPLIRFLLENGADPTIKCKPNLRFLNATDDPKKKGTENALLIFCKNVNPKRGEDSYRKYMNTIRLLSQKFNSAQIFDILLELSDDKYSDCLKELTRIFIEKKGDINQLFDYDGRQRTLLDFNNRNPDFAMFLIKECGVSIDTPINIVDSVFSDWQRRHIFEYPYDDYPAKKIKFLRYLIDHSKEIDPINLGIAVRQYYNFPKMIIKPLLDRGLDPEYKYTHYRKKVNAMQETQALRIKSYERPEWKHEILEMMRLAIIKKHRRLDLLNKRRKQLQMGGLTNKPKQRNQQQLQKAIVRYVTDSTHGLKQDLFTELLQQYMSTGKNPQKISYQRGQNLQQQADD